MKPEIQAGGRIKKIAIAVIGLTLGVVLLLLGSFTPESAPRAAASEESDAESYRADIESRVRAICSRVKGAGNVEVYVTLSGGYEYIYSLNDKGECVTVGNGSSERAVIQSIKNPEIVGVGIVCTGARDPLVKRAICELVCSALDISSNRVVVVEGA